MDPLADSLSAFGLSGFRPGQREVIESVLAGRPTIAVLPTGAGKSLCYQLPAVRLGGLSVVVSPLIALMKDQVDALNARGVPATFINSSVPADERAHRLAAALDGRVRLLYVAPERFAQGGFTGALGRAGLSLFAVDEAHCISEWGHDFRPDYARLGDVVAQLRPPRLVALTATATPEVQRQIGSALGLADPAVFVRGFDRPNLRFSVHKMEREADKLEACRALLRRAGGAALIYAATRKRTVEVAAALGQAGYRAAAYHAGLPDEERSRVQEAWLAGALDVVVATNAFGMGVDKADVRLVVHHDLPGSVEAYYQEAGRGGRDGQVAHCALFFHHADVRLREYLITLEGEGGPRPDAVIEAERARLRAMMRYAYGHGCRRRFLLSHFGDPEAGRVCAGCDVCEGRAGHSTGAAPAPLDDAQHLVVRKVLATVARLDQRFGRQRIAQVLLGSTAEELRRAGLDRLGTFGVLAGRGQPFVLDLLGALEAGGLIASTVGEYPVLCLTPEGREVMHDRRRAEVAWPSARASAPAVRAAAPAASRRREVPAAAVLGEADGPLYDKLRRLRARLAAEASLPAYCIFHDRTLREMASARPSTLGELAAIPGVGPSKLARWGDAFLDVLTEAGDERAGA